MAGSADVAVVGYGLSLLAHAAFAVFLWRRPPGAADVRTSRLFLIAITVSGLWAAASLLAVTWRDGAAVLLAAGLDLARYGAWFMLLFGLLPSARRLRSVASGVLLAAAAVVAADELSRYDLSTARLALMLALPVCGLLMVEQVFRNLGDSLRWSAKPWCLALLCVFGFDVYLFSQGLLFKAFDPDALDIRGGVHALAVPLLAVAVSRGSVWMARLQVSRAAAFYSATLVLSGLYLLLMAGIGYYVLWFGGTWGRPLQLALLAGGLVFLGALTLSETLRSRLRVFVGKHFFTYRYDYREEWLRFTAMLSTHRSPQDTGVLIVRGLASMVECPAGSLWTVDGDGRFVQASTWNVPRETHSEAVDSSLCNFLRSRGWIIDLDEFRASPRRYEGLALPAWLLESREAWLVIPLLAGDDLVAFAVLRRPLSPIELNWEVIDLLKTAGRQAAGYLAQMQATEALLDARKFEAFNRMSAFVVHDLKNIVAQLSLMLRNAERLHDNKEFQQDMLLTVESSLEKMRRLMLQLRDGAAPVSGSRGVELSPILESLERLARAQGRNVRVEIDDRLSTRGHEDRLSRVLGHLLQNALDATPADGDVLLRVSRFSGQVRVEVVDTGAGMSDEFIRTRLFRPFNTTKHNGMGIGSYESLQYIRELGGSIDVASREGAGTTVTVLLPLFEPGYGSDLMPLGER
jgi:putative PEP-CTERM system histidine kinase